MRFRWRGSLTSYRVTIRLRAKVDRRPKPVVVVVALDAARQIARYPQMRIGNHPVPHMPRLDPFVEQLRFLFQRHRPPIDQRDARLRANPNFPTLPRLLHMDVSDLVVQKPAPPMEILPSAPTMPGLGIKSRGPLLASQPDRARFLCAEHLESFNRAALLVRPRLSLSFPLDGGRDITGLQGKVRCKFLRLPPCHGGQE